MVYFALPSLKQWSTCKVNSINYRYKKNKSKQPVMKCHATLFCLVWAVLTGNQSINQWINQSINWISIAPPTRLKTGRRRLTMYRHINVNRVPNSDKSTFKMDNIKQVTSIKHRARKCHRVCCRQWRMSQLKKRRRLGRRAQLLNYV